MVLAENKLIYIADPMCSWCYGFSPELSRVVEVLGDRFSLQLVMGGLRPYNTETMKQLGDFLSKHWQHVAEKSGQAFNYEILNDHSFVYDTEPAARAVVVVRELQPGAEFSFFKLVQNAFYYENKNTNELETYLPLIAQIGMEEKDFVEAFASTEMKEKVRRDFEQAAGWGIAGFPSLIWQQGTKLNLLSNGYKDANTLIPQIEKLLALDTKQD
ncbi:MAG: DsbA family protein [Bacteroidota bacterium]